MSATTSGPRAPAGSQDLRPRSSSSGVPLGPRCARRWPLRTHRLLGVRIEQPEGLGHLAGFSEDFLASHSHLTFAVAPSASDAGRRPALFPENRHRRIRSFPKAICNREGVGHRVHGEQIVDRGVAADEGQAVGQFKAPRLVNVRSLRIPAVHKAASLTICSASRGSTPSAGFPVQVCSKSHVPSRRCSATLTTRPPPVPLTLSANTSAAHPARCRPHRARSRRVRAAGTATG